MGGRMLADRIFGAPERRDPPRRRRQPARKRSGAPASAAGGARARSRGRTSPEVDAAPPRPGRARLHRRSRSTSATSSISAGTAGRSATAPRPRSTTRSGRGRSSCRSRSGSPGSALILRPFLPSPRSVARRGGGGRLRAAARAGRADRRPRPGRRPQGALRPELLPASRRRRRRGPLLGHDHALPAARRADHRRRCCSSPACCCSAAARSRTWCAPRGRGAERAKRGTVGFATAIRESRISTDPDLIDTTPADTEPVFGPPEPVEDGEDFQVLVGGTRSRRPRRSRTSTRPCGSPTSPTPTSSRTWRNPRRADQGCQARRARTAYARGEAEEMGDDGEADEERAPALTPMGEKRGGVTESEEIDYQPPDAEQMLERGAPDKGPDKQDHEAIGRTLLETLGHFGVEAQIVGTVTGPHVSRYELKLAPGTKVSKITQLKDDLAYALASTDIRILAPIPGKQAVGVEVPNQRRRLVRLGDIYGGRPAGRLAAGRLARQGHLRQRRLDRPAEDAARADRRHHRLRQVGQRQRDPQLDPAARLAERGAAGAGRPEAGRAQPLRADPAPADAGGHLAAPRRQRAQQPDRRDGEPLRDHGAGPLPQPRRAQPRPRARGRGAAAAHPLRDRRARRPDDGRAGRGRGRDHPPGAEVARGRHPPAAGDPAPLDRHHHRDDQGQHPGADRLRGLLAGRLAGDPRPGRRRDAARPGGHALPAGGHLEDAADPGRLHHRGGDRQDHRRTGRTRASRTSPTSCSRPPSRPRRRAAATTTSIPTRTTCSTRPRSWWWRAAPPRSR